MNNAIRKLEAREIINMSKGIKKLNDPDLYSALTTSGGGCDIRLSRYNNEVVEFKVTIRIQSDCENWKTEYECLLDRESMLINESLTRFPEEAGYIAINKPIDYFDLERLAKAMQRLEKEACWPLKSTSGSYSFAQLSKASERHIEVNLQWGVQCGGHNDFSDNDIILINRKTMDVRVPNTYQGSF